MKANRLLFELALVLAIAALLVWKFWPTKNSALGPIAETSSATRKNNVLPAPALISAVEAPKAPPANIASPPDNNSLPNNGRALYDASKVRAAGTNIDGKSDPDYNAIINGSPGLAKLRDTMAQEQTLTQSLNSGDHISLPRPPMVATDLGEITLTQDQPVMRKLASGDEVILSLQTFPNAPKGNAALAVQAKFLLPQGDGWTEYPDGQDGTMIEFGRGARIQSFATGNEIHFVPKLAAPAETSH
jgi:hypothetical protein